MTSDRIEKAHKALEDAAAAMEDGDHFLTTNLLAIARVQAEIAAAEALTRLARCVDDWDGKPRLRTT